MEATQRVKSLSYSISCVYLYILSLRLNESHDGRLQWNSGELHVRLEFANAIPNFRVRLLKKHFE